MTPSAALEVAASLLQSRAGFRRDPMLESRLARCLQEAAEQSGRPTDEFVGDLATDPTAFQELVDRVTIQESSFFRDAAQFETLARDVLPGRAQGVLWSAGCANGQEAWSLAMTLHEQGRTDWRVLASDISTAALDRARAGRYEERELRGIDDRRRGRYFVRQDDTFEICSELRELVTFSHHNLAAPSVPFPAGSCSIAFCRNVLIYLTDAQIVALLERLAGALAPGGLLFLGYSESLWRLETPFALRRLGATFVYEVAATVPPSPPRARRRLRSSSAPARGSLGRPAKPEPETPAPAPANLAEGFMTEGQAALVARDLPAAIHAFRKAVYLQPDHPAGALHLAFAFEAIGDDAAARRWFRLAREAILAAGQPEDLVEGWATADLLQVIDRKLPMSAQR